MNRLNRGFTLIELMVTIAIVSVISFMAIPSFSQQISEYQLNQESRNVLSLIRETRAQAILQKRDIKLNFSKSSTDNDTATNVFWSSKRAQITAPANLEFDMLGRIKVRPTNGCIAIISKTDNTFKKAITVGVLGGIDAVRDNSSC